MGFNSLFVSSTFRHDQRIRSTSRLHLQKHALATASSRSLLSNPFKSLLCIGSVSHCH
ncbi:hypothetical protein PGTUg99_007150, partial [Puccinia graminis f. sp. tritici]